MSNSKDKTLSKRVAKYRDELSDSGYARLDVAVPIALKAQLRSLGKEHSLGASQLASILLELALQSYEDSAKTQVAVSPAIPVAPGGSSTARSIGAQALSMAAWAEPSPVLHAATLQSAVPDWANTPIENDVGIVDSLRDTVEISPNTVRMVKQLREHELQKSLDVPYSTAVRLGYADPKEVASPTPRPDGAPAMAVLEKLLKR